MRRGALTMGKNSRGDTETVERFLDSTLESVDDAEELALQEAEKAGVPEDDLHKIAMAVRESMVNAVVHGNRYNAHKKVHLSVFKTPGEFVVRITDQGEGFDYDNLPNPLAQENLPRHLSHQGFHGRLSGAPPGTGGYRSNFGEAPGVEVRDVQE